MKRSARSIAANSTRSGVEQVVVDATGCVVTPGLIDPHEHLLGGSGEGSLALQSPMLFIDEICRAGITTVIGTLGVDITMEDGDCKTRAKLLEKSSRNVTLVGDECEDPIHTTAGELRLLSAHTS